jgi:hypothetical protein
MRRGGEVEGLTLRETLISSNAGSAGGGGFSEERVFSIIVKAMESGLKFPIVVLLYIWFIETIIRDWKGY